MNKRSLFFILFSIFLLSTLCSSFGLHALASPKVIRVPQNHPTIQNAINAANDGDIIQVDAGTYHEHLVVNKALSLIGAGKGVSILDGSNVGTVVQIEADNVTISGFTIQNASTEGIFLNQVINNKVAGNLITSYGLYGVTLEYANNNTIMNNHISNSMWGLGLFSSYNNRIQYNTITTNEESGILLETSNENIFEGNTVSKNAEGITIFDSNENVAYRNNLLNNFLQVAVSGANNTWNNGAEGNHWSDYTGQDTNGDGIGETPYTINVYASDIYPLVELWNLTRAFSVDTPQGVNSIQVVANSTVASFQFNQPLKQISFNVTGPQGSRGFCNVTIPKAVITGNTWTVFLGSVDISAAVTVTENLTHTSLYFTQTHSTVTVRIIASFVSDAHPKIHNIAIVNLTLSSKEVTVGQNVTVEVTVKNKGNFPENFNVTVFYNETTLSPAKQVDDLAENTTLKLTFTWDTRDTDEGTYIITAQATIVPGETNEADNTLTSMENVILTKLQRSFPTEAVIPAAIAVLAIAGVVLYMSFRSRKSEKSLISKP